jgi:hypothetical protein
MDALVAYGSGSEVSDNGGEQKQATQDEGDICREVPGFFTHKDKSTLQAKKGLLNIFFPKIFPKTLFFVSK